MDHDIAKLLNVFPVFSVSEIFGLEKRPTFFYQKPLKKKKHSLCARNFKLFLKTNKKFCVNIEHIMLNHIFHYAS